jgi:hypothetical protein
MKLPGTLLSVVRGAALAAAAGCSSPAPVAIVPEPAPPPAPVAPAEPDPVAYDAAREAARLVAADVGAGTEAARRERRIAFNVEAARRAERNRVFVHPPGWVRPACGRG